MKSVFSENSIREILSQVSRKKISTQVAFKKLKHLPYESLGFARIDHHRQLRKGFPEAIFAQGKSREHLAKIIQKMRLAKTPLLVTRLEEKTYRVLKKQFPALQYSKWGRLAYWKTSHLCPRFRVSVLTAGTGDLPVAEEAAVTLELLGHSVERLYDCGVAGLHRLLDVLPQLEKSRAIICVAGMEGALPSVVAGLVSKPVIAVPTRIGYGAHFEGVSALLTMLNSCAQGIAVVNIDNGFGAACFASLMSDEKEK